MYLPVSCRDIAPLLVLILTSSPYAACRDIAHRDSEVKFLAAVLSKTSCYGYGQLIFMVKIPVIIIVLLKMAFQTYGSELN